MLGAAAGLIGGATIGAAPAAAATQTRRFAIYRKGDRIGEHSLTIEREGAFEIMKIDILIEVYFLGVRAFVYKHRNVEVWKDDVLLRLNAKTNNDGEAEFCRVRRKGDRLRVEGSAFDGWVTGDKAPTSYWRKKDAPWFSSQSGKPLELSVGKSGIDDGERWRVSGDFSVTLDYDASGEWRGCSFPARDGKMISYRQIAAGPRFNA